MSVEDTLNINTYLKFIEFILHAVDESEDGKTIGKLKNEFRDHFGVDIDKLLNQHFGLLRLIPLVHMVQANFLNDTEDGKIIKAIRNAFAHNTYSIDKDGYTFHANRVGGKTVQITYADFVHFVDRVENAFYNSDIYKALRNGA